MKALPAAWFGVETTMGIPQSPPSRISVKMGISPRNGTFWRAASALPPPWPKVPFLGEIPIFTEIREGGDRGMPITVSTPNHAAGKAFIQIAETLMEKFPSA